VYLTEYSPRYDSKM